MRIDLRKIGLGAGLAVLLVLVLLNFADITFADFLDVSPGHVGLALLASTVTIVLRAANYREIATNGRPAPFRPWLQVSLQHQFLFTSVPSGLGDVGFPILAKKHLGLDLKTGAATIAVARLRDLCFLPALGCLGVYALDIAPQLSLAGAMIFGLGGLFLEQILSVTMRHIGKLPFRRLADIRPRKIPVHSQFRRCLYSLSSWISAATALWSAYMAAGLDLSPPSCFVMLAGLNAVGVLAVSVGGLGVAEAGSTGILSFLGIPLAEAAKISLIARPLLLLSVLAACGALWAGLRALPGPAASDRPSPGD